MTVLVAGGGLAGAAAALHLAAAGRRVVLLERAAEPVEKLCGEFLGPRATRELAAIGLDLARLGAHPIRTVALVRGSRTVRARLPFVACGLSRRRLDDALLRLAAARGVAVRRNAAWTGAAHDGPVFLATGKHDTHAHRRAAAAADTPDLLGLKMHWRLAAPARAALAGTTELHLFPDGYAGLQLNEAAANLCLLLPAGHLREAGGDWQRLLAALGAANPVLARRLAGAVPLAARPLAIARVPFGFLHRPTAADPPDLWRLGDQAGVIHAFCGDGMSLALRSARLAARVLADGGTAATYSRALRRRIAGPVNRSRVLFELGRRPAGQGAMELVAAACPPLLGLAAALTRV